MRTLAYLEKTFLENLREWKILSLTLAFAPAFVFLMYAYFHAAPSSYTLLVRGRQRGRGGWPRGGLEGHEEPGRQPGVQGDRGERGGGCGAARPQP